MAFRFVVFFIIMAFAVAVKASDFRTFKSIRTPGASAKPPAAGEAPMSRMRTLDRQTVEKAVEMIVRSWNTPEMGKYHGVSFFDKSRLLDNMNMKVPRDATLRLQSVQGIQTLKQHTKPGTPVGTLLISKVSATVLTQIEYNDPTAGFQRVQGTNEIILEITTLEP